MVKMLEKHGFEFESLEGGDFDQLAAELGSRYPVTFLSADSGTRREIGVAESESAESGIRRFESCVLIKRERGQLSSISGITWIEIRRHDDRNFSIRSGGGYKLSKGPDGWSIKLLEENTVTLSEDLLNQKGWQRVA